MYSRNKLPTNRLVVHQWFWSYQYSDYINESGESIEFDVRAEKLFCRELLRLFHCYNVETTTHLANGESSLVNIACEMKANNEPTQLTFDYLPVVLPMIKAILLEPNHLETSINGYSHCWDGTISMLSFLNQRKDKVACTTQVTRSESNDESLVSKGSKRTECVTGGLPKSPKTQGNGVSIVPDKVKYSLRYGGGNASRKGRDTVKNLFQFKNYSTGCTTHGPSRSNVLDKLNNLRIKASEGKPIDRNLISLLSNPTLLEIAYNNIKSKPGNMTHGITPETLDGISSEWFTETANLLRSGKFEFQPSRRIQIPKASGGTRPLSIGSPKDKVVQEAMRMILDAIYEPNFSDNSHGFRPLRSCHTALRAFYTKFRDSQWIIEGDISKCFDSIDHGQLIKLIENKISDRRFTHYINKAINTGYFEFRVFKHNIAGTPLFFSKMDGSIISPLLANIFLHQLDEYIASLKEKFDKGTKPQRNPKARNFEGRIARAKIRGDMELVHNLSIEARKFSSINFEDPNFRRLMYLRYADDWIIGIRGTQKDTIEILEKVSHFCDSIGLTVSQTKTKITNLNNSKALFLGVELSRSNVTKFARDRLSSSTKRVARNIRLTAPLDRIIKKLTETGFIVKNKPAPRFLWLHYSHDQIIYLYNSVFRGILNYYSFAHNYSNVVSLLNHILKQSAAKLLAAKFKLGTRAKVFAKFGPSLTSPNKTSFIKPSYQGNIKDFKVKKTKTFTLENIKDYM